MGKIAACLLLFPVAGYMALAMVYGRVGLLEKAFGPVRRQPLDFATLRLKPSPNQYLVCPPGLCAAQAHAESPVFDVPFDRLRAAWFRVVARQPRTTLLESGPSEQYTYQVLTPVIHFPDTVTVRLLPAGEGKATIAVYSRSHYGHGDLGVNRRRVRSWLDQLEGELARSAGETATPGR